MTLTTFQLEIPKSIKLNRDPHFCPLWRLGTSSNLGPIHIPTSGKKVINSFMTNVYLFIHRLSHSQPSLVSRWSFSNWQDCFRKLAVMREYVCWQWGVQGLELWLQRLHNVQGDYNTTWRESVLPAEYGVRIQEPALPKTRWDGITFSQIVLNNFLDSNFF